MTEDTPTDEGQFEKSPNQSERFYQERDGEKDDDVDNTAAPGELPENESPEGDSSEERAGDRDGKDGPSLGAFVRKLLKG